MSVRRFGPVLGAGVQVEEKEGDQQINPAPLGVSVMIGDFERGVPGEPAFLSGVLDLKRRNGGRIPLSDAPQAALDFYKLGRGAGELITYRVTGGDERRAELTSTRARGQPRPGQVPPARRTSWAPWLDRGRWRTTGPLLVPWITPRRTSRRSPQSPPPSRTGRMRTLPCRTT